MTIKITVDVTPSQLSKIAVIMGGEPVAPVAPDEPVAPVVPDEPVAPVVPDEPVAPVVPDEPVAPVVPEPSDLDPRGMPWDKRIHNDKKTKNADGTWKYRRGIDREKLVPEVEAEIVGNALVPEDVDPREPPAGSLFDTPTPFIDDPEPTPPTPPAVDSEPTPPAVDSEPTPPTPPTVEGGISFAQLLVGVNKLKTSGKVDDATVDAVAESFGVSNFRGFVTASAELRAEALSALGG